MNDSAVDFAKRLYSRLPSHYRAYDVTQGLPLYALLTVVGQQAANIRDDLDGLWDNFFIETCEDWVVPYIGALAGTNLSPKPVESSQRLDVWNTIRWRSAKGTPDMLQSLVQSISGWPAGLTEFFGVLGWSQNLNDIRGERHLTPDLRKPSTLGLLNRQGDSLAHAADFHPAPLVAEPRGSLGSQGRYNIRNAGFFVSRLQLYPVTGVTPADAASGTVPVAGNSSFSFHPLFRDMPLFSSATGAPIRRSDLAANPWVSFGSDFAIRQGGVLLASDQPPASLPASAPFKAFTFGAAGAALALDPAKGLRLMAPEKFDRSSAHFVLTAVWQNGAVKTALGSIDTGKRKFVAGAAAPGVGQLSIQVAAGAGSPTAWFPGAVVAVGAKSGALLRGADAVYAYLPPTPAPATFDISEDGSSFLSGKLARASEGQIYPPRALSSSTRPASEFLSLHQQRGLILADPARYGGAIQFKASASQGLLAITLTPNAGITSIPPAELILTNRAGDSLLVYLPEIPAAASQSVDLFPADDGSTYFVPADKALLLAAQNQHSLSMLVLARAAAGQSLPIPGLWPIQQRVPVPLNLCSPLRAALLQPWELGIDPELGRFALPPGDPSLAAGNFTVDYAEAFSGPVGALTFDRQTDTAARANRVVSQSGDADTVVPVHPNLIAAVAAANDGDVIEIGDSATYSSTPILLSNAAVRRLTIRAASGERPCLLFYLGTGVPAASSLSVTVPMASLSLDGLLISGGPLLFSAAVQQVTLTACSLDPEPALVTLKSSVSDPAAASTFTLSACITGGIDIGAGTSQLTIADSIVDAKGKAAIVSARTVQLERVTVLGTISANRFTASECLLNDRATILDQQAGCVRFSRFELGSSLPRRFRCIPSDEQALACPRNTRCFAPVFHSRRFGRPDYLQLASATPPELLTASEQGAEVGAFASGLAQLRLENLQAKLQEFMPAGLNAIVIAAA